MPLIPRVEMQEAKKIVTARLGNYIISESLKRLFKHDHEFKQWLEETNSGFLAERESNEQ